MKYSFLLFSFLCAAAFLSAGESDTEYIQNGDFEVEKIPAVWKPFGEVSIRQEGENRYLYLSKAGSGAHCTITLLPETTKIKVSFRLRVTGVEPGDQGWKDTRLAMSFHDKDGMQVGGWPDVLHAKGTSGWTLMERTYDIPPQSAVLKITAANFGSAGTASFDDISISSIQPSVSVVGTELVKNGDFSKGLEGWRTGRGISVRKGGDMQTLLLEGGGVLTEQRFDVPADVCRVTLSFRMKTTDVVPGDEVWKNARMILNFTGADGKRVGDWPDVFNMIGSNEWKTYTRDYSIPQGTAFIGVSPANLGTSGTVEVGDISLKIALTLASAAADLPVPENMKSLWNMKTAWRKETRTRGSICLNDLWRYRAVISGEATDSPENVTSWGWGKVPHVWSLVKHWSVGPPVLNMRSTEYVSSRIDWKTQDQAWFKRTITVPKDWEGRCIGLEFTMIQTHAAVFIDNKKAAEIWFPGGVADITGSVVPGTEQTLSILVTARPLSKEKDVFMAPDRVFKSKADVMFKGITGDLFLVSRPVKESIGDIHVQTSTRKKQITCSVQLDIGDKETFIMQADIFDGGRKVKSFTSGPFTAGDLKDGRYIFSDHWSDPKLWDIHTPENMYTAQLSLIKDSGETADRSLPVTFGFREFWIQGKDFYLNGTPVHLRALHVSNPSSRPDKASLAGSLETCRRLKSLGFNALIWGNYNFGPGSVSYMDGLCLASDRTGVLNAFTLPHAKDYEWIETEEQKKRYRALTEWLIRRVQNHPSIVLYAMSHNACGYSGDQNPLKIDGIYKPKEYRNRTGARAAAALSKSIDPTRPVYHHQSGNLGDLHTINIYLNWAPLQERNDWLQHWSEKGVKPVFFVEWGLPHIASWSSYRGPQFIWRTPAFQSLWDSEFSAPLIGQKAYDMNEVKQSLIQQEERMYASGKPFYFSSFRGNKWADSDLTYHGIQARFADENWRAHRTWGVSSMLPWDQDGLHVKTADPQPAANPDADKNLQQPGIVPDMINPGRQFIYHRGEKAFRPSAVGISMLRWNRPVIGYLGGGPESFTDRGHNYRAGERVRKQAVLVNDSRVPVSGGVSWSVEGTACAGKLNISAGAGRTGFAPVEFTLPSGMEAGSYNLSLEFTFDNGQTQTDAMRIDVTASAGTLSLKSKTAVFDPAGTAAGLLKSLGVSGKQVSAETDLSGYDLLIIGRKAIQADSVLPDLSPVRNILVLEQDADVLQNRIGFRIQERGVRNAYVRAPGHPVVKGINDELMHDWRGSSTMLSPYLENLPYIEESNPKWYWCGFENTRVWRCGNRGTVASVLIEKPAAGNWIPIIDCGFDLQYAPLLEWRGGGKRIVFCQLDVTARTETDPAAETIIKQVIEYLDTPAETSVRRLMAAGGPELKQLLTSLGFRPEPFDEKSGTDAVLVAGPGSSELAKAKAFLDKGGRVLGLGLGADEVRILTGGSRTAEVKKGWPRMITDFSSPMLSGISNAELHWRTELEFAFLQNEGGSANEALDVLSDGRLILCQTAPWMFDAGAKPYLRTTQRRSCFLTAQLLNNLGAESSCPLLNLMSRPIGNAKMDLTGMWKGKVDRDSTGRDEGWFKNEWDDSRWEEIKVPGMFDEQSKDVTEEYNGLYWYRLHFRPEKGFVRDKLRLYIGAVDDESWVWLNGRFLGEVTTKTNPKDYWRFPREYDLETEWINWDGDNVVTVLANDTYLKGGIRGKPLILSGDSSWLESYYIQTPVADDDPYRYYRW